MNKQQMISKDNALIGASYSLSVVEQRLIFLAIIEARNQQTVIEAGGLLRIEAKSYQKHFDVEKHTAYESMKRAVVGLYEAGFQYSKIDKVSGKIGHYKSRWVDKIGYIDELGCVELVFASDVIPLITRLEERYTGYELKQVSGLQSEYAIRLYELMIQWRSLGETNEIPLTELRSKLGISAEQYKKMCNFKARVLDFAVEQINEHTDIKASYKQHKTGNAITGFSFIFKQKRQLAKSKIDQAKPKEISVIQNSWNTAENSMFKTLYDKCPTLTKNYIEGLAKTKSISIHELLTMMFMEHASVDSFELKMG